MMRILVVDNNVELCSILAEFFDSQPDMETVGVAYDGEEALVKLTELRPDVMILDITMPHLDGIGVLERMETMDLDPRPRIIVLTAFSRDELLSRLTELGVDYFIVKPFSLALLAERIREFTQEGPETGREISHQDHGKYHRPVRELPEKRIVKLLHEMGIPPHFKGFTYLRDAVLMCQSRGYVGEPLPKKFIRPLQTNIMQRLEAWKPRSATL